MKLRAKAWIVEDRLTLRVEIERNVSDEEGELLSLLRAWVAGCGDDAYSSDAEIKELIEKSGDVIRREANLIAG